MPGTTALASACGILTLSALLFVGCAKDYRQIVVIEGGKAEFVTYGKGPAKNPKIWAPGRVLAFRDDGAGPGGPGKSDRQGGARLPRDRLA